MINIDDAWYRISVKALIYDDKGHILLSKEDTGKWDLPGGWLDHWEKAEECLKREINEEMWLEVISVSRKPKYFITTNKTNSENRPWIANLCYEVVVKDLKFTPSDECVDVWFFNKDTINEIVTFENVIELFNDIG